MYGALGKAMEGPNQWYVQGRDYVNKKTAGISYLAICSIFGVIKTAHAQFLHHVLLLIYMKY